VVAAPLVVMPLAAQGTSATITLPIDPNGNNAGPFGPAPVGADRFAQTFQRPAVSFDFLRTFTVYLGDFYLDGSGTGLRFRAGIFTVDGNTLGQQLFLSDERAGSGAFPNFEPYTFNTSGLLLDLTMTTFAMLLQATSTQDTAMNAIAASSATYNEGAFIVVGTDDGLLPLPLVPEMAFTATFDAAPTTAVPEPGSVVLLAGGLVGVAAVARRRRLN
ncbi:MAG: PEP-CTERM sorting domain-containing protein, partial [Candidatus Eremiobacteraeota bacterium]|nr:PEP-CTERM sorting domain-containing protein [Candidatus Eremiobacteraeota bacterium]